MRLTLQKPEISAGSDKPLGSETDFVFDGLKFLNYEFYVLRS